MKVIRKIEELKKNLSSERKKGKTSCLQNAKTRSFNRQVGFIPTMGALHQGHVSLIDKARQENDLVLVSTFLNPTQFDNKEDLDKYPRTEEKDIQLLAMAGSDVVFIPSVEEMYPKSKKDKNERWKTVDLGTLGKVMEAKHRPGHFYGVMQVVSKLFDIAEPTRTYFGQKDFQQLAVIKEMVKQLHYNIEIIACPTLREPGGLAMSSRNSMLTAEERKIASEISQTLFRVQQMTKTKTVDELIAFAEQEFKKLFALEYFEIADAETLLPVKKVSQHKQVIACVALHLGKVRLIDNVCLNI